MSSQFVEVPVECERKGKGKIPKGLEERLSRKKKAGVGVEEKLAAAEERRNERLDFVKKRAVETRAMLMMVMEGEGEEGGGVQQHQAQPSAQVSTLKDDEAVFVSSATPEFWNMTHAVSIQKWPQALQNMSLESLFLPLSPSLVKFLSGTTTQPTPEDKTDLTELEALLDTCIASLGGEAFVKLSSRSGKDDAILQCSPDCGEFLKNEMEAAGVAELEDENLIANVEAVSVLKTVSEGLVMRSGEQVLGHFVGSSRIATDLKKSLVYEGDRMEVIVRRFSREIQPRNEWRCFVRGGKLTAISQYHHHCFFEDHPVNLQGFIEDFVNTSIIPHLPVPSAVVDVCCDPTTNTRLLIELNPFHYTTEGCLYDWMSPTDLAILTSPAGPVSFRRRTHPSRQAAAKHVSRSYRTVIDAWRYEKSLSLLPSPSKKG
eukprot:TRINITY_DN4668_c0_g1_i1.p1 TRINITY_DN4668_c0_g1~~TRINITY_DN4668_c0_g1_i1.p1  ORF type:complete len:430 (+),score=86.61 TRINITY_DN4668_c0_g1_i1:102-1391(+)